MTNFQKVKGNGCILLFPYTFPEHDRYRGNKGFVVDLDAPCEAEWCKDQEHKLEPAPEATEASPINHPQARMQIRKELARREEAAKQPKEPVGAGVSSGASSDGFESLEVARPGAKRKAG